MKRVGVLVVLLAAALAVATAARTNASGVLAIVGNGPAARLGHVDPATLKLVGRSTQVGLYTWASARDPGGTRVALARGGVQDGIRIVDLGRMRTIKAFRLGTGDPNALAWVAPRKLLVVGNGLVVAAVDPVTGKQRWQRVLPGFFSDVARTADGFAFLSPPPEGVGKTTLTTVSSAGSSVRSPSTGR